MGDVFLEGLGVDDGVVQEGGAETVEIRGEGLVDVCLEGGGGIGQAEGHDEALEESVSSSKGGFPLVAVGHPNEVVGSPDVQLGEVPCLAQLHQCFLDQGEWVTVLDRLLLHPASGRSRTITRR